MRKKLPLESLGFYFLDYKPSMAGGIGLEYAGARRGWCADPFIFASEACGGGGCWSHVGPHLLTAPVEAVIGFAALKALGDAELFKLPLEVNVEFKEAGEDGVAVAAPRSRILARIPPFKMLERLPPDVDPFCDTSLVKG